MQGSSNDPKESRQRIALLEGAYPGPKTEAYYKAIEEAGIAIERPAAFLAAGVYREDDIRYRTWEVGR